MRPPAAPLLLLLLLGLLLLSRCGSLGARASAAAHRPAPPPAAPQHLRFRARAFQHLLLWAPARPASPPRRPLLYEVQCKRYGHPSWTPVPRCAAIARCSCDLTAQTPPQRPSRRYYARVRALDLDRRRASPWTVSAPFSPNEAALQLWNLSLSLSGNDLWVTLGEVYKELHLGRWGHYQVYVRRESNDTQYMLVQTNRRFKLPEVLWGERYCVSAELHLPSWPNPPHRTEEQCISTPPPTDSGRATAILGLTLLSLVALGTLAVAWGCAYVKKPTETPSVLKSLQKQTSLAPWREPWPLWMSGGGLCLEEAESIHPISLGLKTHPHPATVSQPSRTAWPVPEEGMCRRPEAFASSRASSPRLRDLLDSSGCSTDSGICLQDPLGSRHGLLLPTGPWEHGGLLLESKGEGVIRKEQEEQLLGAASPASEAELVGRDSEEALTQAKPSPAQVPGHQRQAGAPGVAALGSSSCPPSFESMAHSQQVSVSGYLKQASVAVPSAPVAPQAGLRSSLGSTHQGQQQHLLFSTALPGGLEFPKALLASSFLEQQEPLLRASAPSAWTFPGTPCDEDSLQRHAWRRRSHVVGGREEEWVGPLSCFDPLPLPAGGTLLLCRSET
ncbi:interleukin-10 receptor subunit alpha-like [Heteronotia binoei]|uniref:interleukin-10 receptor subunit alpha-like n=1 Tax=Heteronotia binoei TaxID=13085 RepID=UPI00292F18F3|nr:interleukin-10 receptor subunit alpha-like [Heteronotia binoei]